MTALPHNENDEESTPKACNPPHQPINIAEGGSPRNEGSLGLLGPRIVEEASG